MSFPESLKGVLESMRFCPKCGKLLERCNDDPQSKNTILICNADRLTLQWEQDRDYWDWSMTVEISETANQFQTTP